MIVPLYREYGWPIVAFPIIFFALFWWGFGDTIVGFLFRLVICVLGDRVPFTSVKLHTQDDICFGTAYGVSWYANGRRFFYFRDYMGWHNLSEGHRGEECDDPAYCPWHGSL